MTVIWEEGRKDNFMCAMIDPDEELHLITIQSWPWAEVMVLRRQGRAGERSDETNVREQEARVWRQAELQPCSHYKAACWENDVKKSIKDEEQKEEVKII